jgi:hypothetical protein
MENEMALAREWGMTLGDVCLQAWAVGVRTIEVMAIVLIASWLAASFAKKEQVG